jgi:cation-transporting P-type ATPase E
MARPTSAIDESAAAPVSLTGLSEAEAKARAERGLRNATETHERSNGDILRDNALTFFNVVLGSLIAILLALAVVDRNVGDAQDGLFVGIVAAANIAIGTFQEIRATRSLRQLVALSAPRAAVLRDGEERALLAEDIVQGDLLRLRPGDQVVADGPVVAGEAEIDESLLTGEARSVRRVRGDELLSGSFCSGGGCYYTAERVGADAYAFKLAQDARTRVVRKTPLQLRFERILRVLLVATFALGVVLLISYNVRSLGLAESIKATTATVTSVVPEGLLLGMTVAFAIGAVRVSRRGALVQEIAAVEALNYVDVVCLDKTGTITANLLTLNDVHWAAGARADAGWLGAYTAATADESRTAAALAVALGDSSNGATSGAVTPFNSERRWSGRELVLGSERRAFVLGAPEALLPLCDGGSELASAYDEASASGMRGVLFAEARSLPRGDAALSGRLRPLALLVLGDVLRPEMRTAFAAMAKLGITPKVISGDNPETVAALVRQLGVTLSGGSFSGSELDRLSEEGFARAVETGSVFGRILPQQKERIVSQLRRAGHYVAMVGDGANDVHALRAADVAIAMESGTGTARAVAGIVLLKDSFAAFVYGTREARAVLGNAERLSKLFLAKSGYAFLIIVATNMLGLDFPFLPRHGSLTALLTLGIPAIFISASVPPDGAGRDFTRNVLRFALPAAFSLAATAIVVYLIDRGLFSRPLAEGRTLVSVTLGITALFFMLEVLGFEGARLRNPTRPVLTTVLAALLLGGLLLTLQTDDLRRFFNFTVLDTTEWIVVVVAVGVALAGQFLISRYWQAIIDVLIAKPSADELPRGRMG